MNKSKFIVNPLTQRLIKVHGKTWLRLVKDGILETEKKENELAQCESKESAMIMKESLAKKYNNKDQKVVRDRSGKRVVLSKRKITRKEMDNRLSSITNQIIIDVKNGNINLPDKNAEEFIQEEILKRMMKKPTRKNNVDVNTFELIEPESEESESESESESEVEIEEEEEVEIPTSELPSEHKTINQHIATVNHNDDETVQSVQSESTIE